MDVLGIVLSLFLSMFMAYMGFSVILLAPVFALLAASLQGMPILPSYTELFMAKAVVYVKLFFPAFLLGAVFWEGDGRHSSAVLLRNTRRCFKPGFVPGGHVQKRDRIMIGGKLTNDESQAVTVVCESRPPGVRPLQNRLARTRVRSPPDGRRVPGPAAGHPR